MIMQKKEGYAVTGGSGINHGEPKRTDTPTAWAD